MLPLVITNNVFYKVALTWLIEKYFPSRVICLIDLEGCTRLQDLMQTIEVYEFSNEVEVFFFGDKGIYPELFSKFNLISGCYTQDEIYGHIASSRGISLNTFSEHVTACRSLKNLTRSQLRTCILRRYKSNHAVACMLNLSPKTVESTLYSAVKRMGMNSTTSLCHFISREFDRNELDWLLLRSGTWF